MVSTHLPEPMLSPLAMATHDSAPVIITEPKLEFTVGRNLKATRGHSVVAEKGLF